MKITTLLITAAAAIMLFAIHADAAALAVDHGFSPPEWQTAICLPDDPYKTLVDDKGRLLYHYDVGRDFGTIISVSVAPDEKIVRQELHSPRVPIVRTFKSAPGLDIVEETFTVTQIPGTGMPGGPHNDIILVSVTNTGAVPRTISPVMLVDSILPLSFVPQLGRIMINKNDVLTASPGIREFKISKKRGNVAAQELSAALGTKPAGIKPEKAALGDIAIAPGETKRFFIQYSGGNLTDIVPLTFGQAAQYLQDAIAYWQAYPLPWGRIQVPDPGIQALVDSSIRNIWQAREIKNGLPAFQVGPTCYRGLWIVDGAFLLEAAAMLGAGKEARSGIAYTLSFQQPDGRFEVLKGFHKENGIVVWTCLRHALLTQDKAWLESVWPAIEKAINYISMLREQSLKNEKSLDDGLMPPGFPDGGLGPSFCYEYTNTYWNLAGLKAAIQAADWLGKKDEAAKWRKVYDDFYSTFRATAERDMLKDPFGNEYVPTYMGEDGKTISPQRAQWSFCHAVYPGQIFDEGDPFVTGMMDMLRKTEQEGMVFGTGWDDKGIWNYFASFYGHAWLWNGDGRKAAEALYAFANHAAPVLDWREEQSLKGEPFRKVGDMPHNWASAEFIRLTVHLLAIDRGKQLHLFEGLPAEWVRPGMTTKLDGIATPFGALYMELKVSDDGSAAHLRLKPLADSSCEKIVVHLKGWADTSKGGTIELKPNEDHSLAISLK